MLPVWPTKRGWLALVIALGSFGVAMVNLSLAASVISALLWAILPASLLMALGSLRDVTVRRDAAPDGTLGLPVAMPMRVTNGHKRYRQALVLLEACEFAESRMVATPIPPLKPLESRTLTRTVRAVRRGEFNLDKVILRGGDPAGLFYRQRVLSLPRQLVIYPARVALHQVPLQLRHRVVASATGHAIGVSGSGQEFFGVRPYRPTDGMQVIHWKASARQRQLMVREFEENQIHQVSILLDTRDALTAGPEGETNLEQAIKAAASLVHYLGGVYCRVLFAAADSQGIHEKSGIGPEVRQEIMRQLAVLTASHTDLLEVFEQVIEKIPPNSVVYCLSLGDPSPLNNAFDLLLRQGVDIRCLWAPAEPYRKQTDTRRAGKYLAATGTNRSLKPVLLGPNSDLKQVLSHG